MQSLDADELVLNQCGDGSVAYVRSAMAEFGAEAVFDARSTTPDQNMTRWDSNTNTTYVHTSYKNFSCLGQAAKAGRNELVTFLIERGLDVDQWGAECQTALIKFVNKAHKANDASSCYIL